MKTKPIVRSLAAKAVQSTVLLTLSFIVWRLMLNADVESALEKISRRGEPIDLTQLDARHSRIPDEENAARLWLAGYDQLAPTNQVHWQTPWSNLKLPARGIPASPELLREAVHLLETNRTALSMFRRAAAMSKCQYPVDSNKRLWKEAPHLWKLQSIAKLLRLEAYVRAVEGDLESASSATLTLLALGQSLRNEPTCDSIRVRAWIDSLSRDTLARTLNQIAFGEFHLDLLAAAFAQVEDEQMLARD